MANTPNIDEFGKPGTILVFGKATQEDIDRIIELNEVNPPEDFREVPEVGDDILKFAPPLPCPHCGRFPV